MNSDRRIVGGRFSAGLPWPVVGWMSGVGWRAILVWRVGRRIRSELVCRVLGRIIVGNRDWIHDGRSA